MVDDAEKTCFVISPIGVEGTESRDRADQVLHYVIEPAAQSFNYRVVRADAISTPGMITSQVIEHVLNSPLVIADLTDHNPNVFYELAVRHFVRRPYIQLMDRTQTLPFDVAGYRTIFFELTLIGAADAIEQIKAQIETLEKNPTDLDTPISITADLMSLGRMTNPGQGDLSQLLPLLTDINSTMHNYGREIRRLRSDLSRIPRREQGPVIRVGGHTTSQSTSSVIQELEVTLNTIRGIAPDAYRRVAAARSSIRTGDMAAANALLGETAEIINAYTDLPPELRDRLLFEVTGVQGWVSEQLREEREVDDLPF